MNIKDAQKPLELDQCLNTPICFFIGDIVPLKGFLDAAERQNALTFVDEVHAVGLYGDHGAGVAEEIGCMHRIDAITGTMGKVSHFDYFLFFYVFA